MCMTKLMLHTLQPYRGVVNFILAQLYIGVHKRRMGLPMENQFSPHLGASLVRSMLLFLHGNRRFVLCPLLCVSHIWRPDRKNGDLDGIEHTVSNTSHRPVLLPTTVPMCCHRNQIRGSRRTGSALPMVCVFPLPSVSV
jgi:hypothetical protein